MAGGSLGIERWAVASAFAALAAAIVAPVAARAGVPLAVALALACLAAVPFAARRLPESFDGGFARHRALSCGWLLLVLIAFAQLARLSAFMFDPANTWGSAVPDPEATGHQCMSAYVHAADLARRGEPNLYDERWYPAFRGLNGASTDVESPVGGLSHWLEDPFEYPPQFLLLPRAALAVSNSFLSIRAAWFALHALAVFGAALAVAAWIGGREGRLAALLVPAIAASLPTGLELQFGQFHGTAIALAVLGMLAFEARRDALGGSLLAAAVLAKIFPGVLLVWLLARRRFRALGWTLAFGAGFTLLALLVFGPDPFRAFFDYQLPRLASGQAFAFAERPDVPVLIVSRNFSVYGIAHKLRLLGVDAASPELGRALSWLWTFVVLWVAWRARGAESRLARAELWLALLNLAALRSPVAPIYVVAASLWLLSLLAGEIRGRVALGAALAFAWLLLSGTPPLPDRVDLGVNLVAQGLLMALSLWVALRGSPAGSESAPPSVISRLTEANRPAAIAFGESRQTGQHALEELQVEREDGLEPRELRGGHEAHATHFARVGRGLAVCVGQPPVEQVAPVVRWALPDLAPRARGETQLLPQLALDRLALALARLDLAAGRAPVAGVRHARRALDHEHPLAAPHDHHHAGQHPRGTLAPRNCPGAGA
jgi:hypothetical protein